ncbi:MAG: hypothetical protein QGH95_04575, partial [Candidatus Nitrosopelagicus sp.]|nr:hypothetical protein [Candidatus Nitrosopelagicus sp.]
MIEKVKCCDISKLYLNFESFNEKIKNFKKMKKNSLPSIMISKNFKSKFELSNEPVEQIKMPFSISEFEKKVISVIAKTKFKENSLINLKGYIIDKNERKIKRNQLELQLS